MWDDIAYQNTFGISKRLGVKRSMRQRLKYPASISSRRVFHHAGMSYNSVSSKGQNKESSQRKSRDSPGIMSAKGWKGWEDCTTEKVSYGQGLGALLYVLQIGSRTVFPIPLQQVFGAQGILSSGAATGLVVFMHLPVDVLRKRVISYPSMDGMARTRLTCSSV